MWVGLDRKERGGLDPLAPGFTVAALQALCARNKLWPIKTLLCDQRLIAGLGNAYADEILWEARVKPRRTASLMTAEEIGGFMRDRHHAGGGHCRASSARRNRAAPRRAQARILPRPPPGAQALPTLRRQDPDGSLRDRSTYWCPTCQP